MSAATATNIPLDLPLRGNRIYLHSTTIFDAILPLFVNPREITFTIRQQIDHPVLLTSSLGDRRPLGEFRCTDGDTTWQLHLCEECKSGIAERAPDNEPEILSTAQSDSGRLSAIIGSPGTMIETVVALQKQLIELIAKPVSKVWFSRIDVVHPVSAGRVSVDRLRVLGHRLFQSRISDETGKIGTIVFMAAGA